MSFCNVIVALFVLYVLLFAIRWATVGVEVGYG
jgi:hypothetical protein